ncbi:MAG: DUF2283 domain-containing protein [Candidatus Aenigmarchaeota archaeon]|nr:DUF2283 domain-containing protein [Candidatus Aenigmarchaeota archaeon]
MKVTYDKDADAAYIYLKGRIQPGEVKDTIMLNENIILDFNKDRKLIGIEILSASMVMPKAAVASIHALKTA